jgi:hypothetical protein
MPDRTDEERLARFVEKLWRIEMGLDAGPERTYEPEGYGVDFIYPQAARPIALEITTLKSPTGLSAQNAVKRWGPRLNAIAKQEELGYWWLHHDVSVNLKELFDEAVNIMRTGQSKGINPYHGWWMERKDHIRHGFDVWTTESPNAGSTDTSLRLAVTVLNNADKLAATKPRHETHLAIEVGYGQLARYPSEVHVPPRSRGFERLAAVDWVWVIPRVGQREDPTAWWATPGDKEWSTSQVEYDPSPG